MATLYTAIAAKRTAQGAPVSPLFALDMMGNDWSIISGTQGVHLEEDTATAGPAAPIWIDMQDIWIEFPASAFALDATFDGMEFAITLRVQAKTDGGETTTLRLTDEAETIFSNTITVTGGTYSLQSYFTLVWSAIPTDRTQLKLQGMWAADPGGSPSLYAKSSGDFGDIVFWVRRT